MINDLSETLKDDLYEKTRAQLNAFIEETNALLAAGDALHEDRTAVARARLTEFLNGGAVSALEVDAAQALEEPPVTRALLKAKNLVQSNPWAAVGAAAAIGLGVSLLLKRRQY